jgi:hypothetical protein
MLSQIKYCRQRAISARKSAAQTPHVWTAFIIACLSLAAAAQVGHDRSTDASAMPETTGSISGREHAIGGIALSDEQRGRIYDRVMRIPDAAVAHVPAPEIADALPSGVPLQDLPAGLAREIPLLEGYKFVKFDDRIVVVEPTSRVVAAMMPRYKLLP